MVHPRPKRTGTVTCRTLLALFVALGLTTLPPRVAAAPSEDKADKLQRAGEDLYDAQDVIGARRSWLAAVDSLAPTYEHHGTIVTLLVLAASATLEQHALEGDTDLLREMIDRIDGFDTAATDLDPALRATLADERRRLQSVLDHAEDTSAEEAPPAPAPEPEPLEPIPDAPAPKAVKWTPWVIAGSITAAAGIASIGAGAAFGPRARAQVADSPDPASRTDAFVQAEQDKGLVWIGIGSALVATGVSLIIVGVVRRSRGRGQRSAPTGGSTARVVLGGVRW